VIGRKGRPLRLRLSGGQCFDGKAAVPLLEPLPPPKKLLADKACDCAAFRDWLTRRGTTPVIPNKINRRKPYLHNKRAYRHRNKIARMFCRRKDARRSATRDDKCANTFLSAICLVALICF
jgi:transposase